MRSKGDYLEEEVKRILHQYLERQRQLQARGKLWQKRRRIILLALVLTPILGPVFFLKGYMLYQDLARHRVVMKFVRAVEDRDGKTLCRLVTPYDREKFNLTPEKVETALNMLFHGLGKLTVGRVKKFPPLPNQADPTERFWRVYWKDKVTNTFPPDMRGDKAFCSGITVKPTPEGFRVSFGAFLASTAKSRWGYEQGLRAVRSIRQKIGL